MSPLSSSAILGLEPPKLASWLGVAARDPARAVVVVVAVPPGASVVVVSAVASWPRKASLYTPWLRSIGAPNVLPASVETANSGRDGSALGATLLGMVLF